MSSILIPVPKALTGCTIYYHPNPPQKFPNPSQLVPTCPVPPNAVSTFKQTDDVVTGSFSVTLNSPGKLTLKAGYFSDAPSVVYLEVSYNGVPNSSDVYTTRADVMIPGLEGVNYTKILIYLNNQNGEGSCKVPPFPFGDIMNSGGPPSSGTTSTGTTTTVQKGDEDTNY